MKTYKESSSIFEGAIAALKKCQIHSWSSGDCQSIGIEEKIIRKNHEMDVENGLNEIEADESDDFEKRVLGLD